MSEREDLDRSELTALLEDPARVVWPSALSGMRPVSVAAPDGQPEMTLQQFVALWQPVIQVWHVDVARGYVDVVHSGVLYRWTIQASPQAWEPHLPQTQSQATVARKWIEDLVADPEYRAAESKRARERVARQLKPALVTAEAGEHTNLRARDAYAIYRAADELCEQQRAQTYAGIRADSASVLEMLKVDGEFLAARNDSARRERIVKLLTRRTEGWPPPPDFVRLLLSQRPDVTGKQRAKIRKGAPPAEVVTPAKT